MLVEYEHSNIQYIEGAGKMTDNKKRAQKSTESSDLRDKASVSLSERLAELLDPDSKNFIMTGAALANEAQISEGIISHYRQGKSTPNAVNLLRMAEKLEVSTDYLLGLTDVKEISEIKKMIAKQLGLSEKAIDRLEVLNHFFDKDFIAAMNFILESEQFQEIISGIIEIKVAKEVLDHYKPQLLDEIKAYKNSDEGKKDLIGGEMIEIDKRMGKIKVLKKEYAFTRWHVAYALENMLNGLKHFDTPGIQHRFQKKQERMQLEESKRSRSLDEFFCGENIGSVEVQKTTEEILEQQRKEATLDKLLAEYKSIYDDEMEDTNNGK
jgi:transcriptional regulator with XRE-family HTH domain